jgi:hypothetical protein
VRLALSAQASGEIYALVVVREGAGFRVGNRLCTLATLRAKAARERRLASWAESFSDVLIRYELPRGNPNALGAVRFGKQTTVKLSQVLWWR